MTTCGLIDATLFAGIGLALIGVGAMTFAGLIRRRGEDAARRAMQHQLAALRVLDLIAAGRVAEAQTIAQSHDAFRDDA